MLFKKLFIVLLMTTLFSCGYFSSEGAGSETIGNPNVEAPPAPEFPWPPPKASAKKILPTSAFSEAIYYKDVDRILSEALEANGYEDKSYFTVPSEENFGFVLVTQLEQINVDATSKPDTERWSSDLTIEDLTFKDYIKAIFFSEKGYFRVIVFIVTDLPFQQTGDFPDRDTALSWLQIGTNKLPESVCYTPYTEAFTVTALIYEYELEDNSENAELQKPSKHSGKTHLVRSKLWKDIVQ